MKIIHVNCRVKNYMKQDHRNCLTSQLYIQLLQSRKESLGYGHLALKSRSQHIRRLAVSIGEALPFTLMVNQLWEAGQRKRVAGALHSAS